MVTNYEFTVILESDEEKFKAGLDFVKETFSKFGVVIEEEHDNGVRTLSYLIKKKDRGHYVYFVISADGLKVGEMSDIFNLSTLILKFLFIKRETE